MLKNKSEQEARNEILRIAEIFGAKIIDVSTDTYTIEFSKNAADITEKEANAGESK